MVARFALSEQYFENMPMEEITRLCPNIEVGLAKPRPSFTEFVDGACWGYESPGGARLGTGGRRDTAPSGRSCHDADGQHSLALPESGIDFPNRIWPSSGAKFGPTLTQCVGLLEAAFA